VNLPPDHEMRGLVQARVDVAQPVQPVSRPLLKEATEAEANHGNDESKGGKDKVVWKIIVFLVNSTTSRHFDLCLEQNISND
jgi:hypothetical protein